MAKILLAEGETDLRWSLRYALVKNKFEVVEVSSGDEIMDRCKREKPELIVLDAHMPRVTGMAALEALKADPVTKAIPVLFMTLSSEKKGVEQALARGAKDVLPKTGFTVLKLIYSVRKALEPVGA